MILASCSTHISQLSFTDALNYSLNVESPVFVLCTDKLTPKINGCPKDGSKILYCNLQSSEKQVC